MEQCIVGNHNVQVVQHVTIVHKLAEASVYRDLLFRVPFLIAGGMAGLAVAYLLDCWPF